MESRSWRQRPGAVAVALVLALLGNRVQSEAQEEADDPRFFWTQATLYRDDWGTPHVFGDNPRALAFAFGYAQAEDHIEPMLMAYRVANGRAAEVLGEFYAESDEFALKLRHAELADEALADADLLTCDLCEGFALGVNAWIVEHPDRVPPWADGVKPADVLALMHCYLMSMAPFDLPGAFRRAPPAFTGNAWAVAPERTEDGKAILVINPHGDYDGPFRWYEAHLVSGAMGLNVAGATLFGLPVILQGHNEVLGWALTPNWPDIADVYIAPRFTIPRNPKDPTIPRLDEERLLYMALMANMRPYYVLTPDGMVERRVPCLDTAHGPVVGWQQGRLCSFQAGGYHDFGALAQCIEMARAQTLVEFQMALEMQQFPCFHVVYADRDGNIFYLYNAKVFEKRVIEEEAAPHEEDLPGLPTHIDWTMPLPGDHPAYDWGDLIPVDALPFALNPEAGYIQACGNPPWTATGEPYLNPENWPPWMVTDRDTYRARRVRQLLTMGQRSFRDSQSMLYDVLAPFAVEAAARLLEAADNRPEYIQNAHPDLALGLDLLRNWNYTAAANASAMTFFHTWWSALYAGDPEAFDTDDDLYAALEEYSPGFQDLMLDAAAAAARVLRNEFNSVAVPWGKVHVIGRGDREEPVGGAVAGEPIFVASGRDYVNGRWPVTYGYGFAMVVEFGQWPRAVSMVPFGASEDPKSPHFDDQLDLMLERRFKVTRFLDADVQRNAVSARGRFLYLRPKGMHAGFTFRAPWPIEARLYTALEPPEPLPDGLATFTVYVGPEYVPHDVPAEVGMTITIPETLCAEENLHRLAIYAYDTQAGWYPLPTHRRMTGARTLSASDARPHVYAVLGPEACRISDETPVLQPPPPPPATPRRAPKATLGTPPPRDASQASQLMRQLSGEDMPDQVADPLQPRQTAPGKWVQPVPWAEGPTPPLFELEIDGPSPFGPILPEMAAEPPPEPERKPRPEPQQRKRSVNRNFTFRKKR